MSPVRDSKAEAKELRRHAELILTFLRSQYEAMSAAGRRILYDRAEKAAEEAMKQFNDRLHRMSELRYRDPDGQIAIRLEYRAPKSAFGTYGGPQIEWGMANAEAKTVHLLRWIIFAPKEVIRGVVIHEAFHILYSCLDPKCIADVAVDLSLSDYPQHQRKEEHWVREMTAKVGYGEHLVTVWEQAILANGKDWRPLYYELKKKMLEILAEG